MHEKPNSPRFSLSWVGDRQRAGRREDYAGLMHKVAHELRSPLTVIQMHADALSAMADLGRVQRAASIISEQSSQIARLLEYALTLFDDTADADGGTLVDINMAAIEATETLRRLAMQRRIELQVRAAELGAVVKGSTAELGRAVRACIQTMVLSAPEGSPLVVEVATRQASDGKHSAEVMVTARVEDRAGPGGSQVAIGWDRVPIMAAQRIVRQHNGQVEALSAEEGWGIRLRLPRYQQAAVGLGQAQVIGPASEALAA